MSMFDRFRRRKGPATGGPTGKSLADLKDFLKTREGVEGFVEPPTAVYAMTLCLVAADGEYHRQPVKDEKQARQICTEAGVPLYDARIVGYPKRMREFEKGIRRTRISIEEMPPLDVFGEPEEKRRADE